MKNVFIEYPKCSTCKKAKKYLTNNKMTSDNYLFHLNHLI